MCDQGLGKRKLHPSQLAGDDTAVKRLNLGVHSTQDGGGLRSAHSDLRPGDYAVKHATEIMYVLVFQKGKQ